MTARKAIFGLCAVCAMLFSAFAAQSAMAVSQTGVTCASTSTGAQFKDAHCKESPAGSEVGFKHVAFAGKTTGTLTNTTTGGSKESGFLKATIGGLETIIEAKTVAASGSITNEEVGGEMLVKGETETIKFSEVSVTNRTCTFTGVNPGGSETVGSVETQPVTGSTAGQAKGVVKFQPKAGETAKFAEFKLSGASCPEALVGTYPVFGVVLSNAAEGATLPIVHNTVTTQTGQKLRLKNATTGPLAGLAGKITISAGAPNPISVT
jgi:hypothetical protein